MLLGKKPQQGRNKFVLALVALLIASASLCAVPAYAAEDGSASGNPVVDFFSGLADGTAHLLGLDSDEAQTYAVKGADTAVDPNTTNDWTKFTRPDGQPSTQNVGRIWTDKSVFNDTYTFSGSADLNGQTIQKGDSDFLVGLSALSSMSNLKETTTTTTPLDIVLVVDTSGSMDNGEGDDMGYAYTEAYPQGTYGTYYVQDGGEWHELNYNRNRGGWYYNAGSWRDPDYRVFTPKTSADDGDPTHTQFYSRERVNKMEALQRAANTFVDSVAALNDSIADPNDQHRISLVKFASNESNSVGDDTYYDREYDYRPNYSQVVSDLQAYTSNTADSLKNTINRLEGEGATRADYGLHQAQRVLNGDGTLAGAREGAQKVVIFFTDGEPTTYQNFNNEVASSAVNYARSMKQDGTLVYSIGVVQGADPSDDPTSNRTSNINKFLHAVSSNYKNATYEEGWSGWRWSFGDRTTGAQGEPNPNYYFAATDADELDQVFEDITSSITENAGSGSPIVDNSTEGNTDPGNLTFTDQLGAYMQVTGTGAGDDKMQLAYGDTIYTSDSKTTSGNTDTYHFSGQVEGNAVYGAANLADLVVTVERSNDPAVGDKVTVQLPASLLPLRNYDVDTDNHTMTVAEAYPVRLFYGVSLKAEAEAALNDPTSDVYAAIMGSQKSEDGKTVDFYTNSFVKGVADGSATASFEPNAGNKFYYYTQDTPLYIDEDCTTEATRENIGGVNAVYWKDTYWVQTQGGGAEEHTAGVAVNRGTDEWEAMKSTGGYDGTYYIPAGTPRSDRPATLTSAKTENTTGTATNVLNPAWAGTSVNQHLGNNGKLSLDMPGSLEIKKNVDWGNASDQTKQEKNTFMFDITANVPTGEGEATEALTGTYNYYVGDSDAAAGQVTFTDGSATLTVTGGTTVRIDGLPAGTTFTVTEQGVGQNGWTVTDATSQEDVENTNTTDGMVTGTIPAGSQASLTFSNTYHANEVGLNTNTTLKVQKNLEGRDWRDTDEFTFEIDGLGNTAGTGVTTPEPADTTITVNSQTPDHTASFGDITFTMPGEYRYSIVEDNDTNPIAGIDYSGAFYRVVVTVTDNGTGNLEVSNVAIEQRTNDDGVENSPAVEVQGDTVTFVNKYDADGGTTNIDGTKSYTDTTGGNPINADKFTFKIEALGGYDTNNPQTSPYTYGVDETPLPASSDEATHSKTVYNTGYDFTFGTIAFDGGDIGRTYEYKVTELAQNEDGQAEEGMTYDTKEYTVKVAVTEVTDADGTHIVAAPDIAPKDLVFTNTYKPTDVTLGADGVAPIQGTKTLDGRDMKDGETFFFQLTQTGGPAADGGGFVTVLGQPETVTVSKDDVQNGSADFKFSNLTFSQVGTYTFTVNEVADEQGTETANGSGMTYDTNVATVTVNVSDNHDGTLKAKVTYQNDKHADTTDKALFVNTYEASMNYGAEGEGGINVTKQMLDRPMANNEFSFTIAGTDSGTVGADEANAKLAAADKSFQNTAAAENGTATMAKLQSVTFDQDDAGKTFSYLVSETVPADGDKLVNVAYDQSQYRMDIEVVDNGDSTMHTVTTVTKIKASDGTEVSKVVIDHANSDTQDYAAPTFGFVNDYNPTPATVGEDASHQIQVTKHVTGADSAADYTFTLTATGDNIGNIEGLDQNDQLTVSTDGTIKDGESQTKTYGKLTFTEPGTYTFTVQENQPAAAAGWTFDDADGDGATDAHTVTVYVTDRNEEGRYDGNLYIDRVDGSPVEITNSYDADPVIVGGDGAQQQITVQKTVTGADSTADFQFEIEPVDVDDPKWSNVEVVDENFDALTSITGGVTQAHSKTATFGGIKFNAKGEYQFRITEVGAAEFNDGTAEERAGWTYDEHEAVVTVTVTDDDFDGQLEAAVSYDNGAQAAEFTNSYTPGEVSTDDPNGIGNIQVTKEVKGNATDAAFDFTLTLTSGNAANVLTNADDPQSTFPAGGIAKTSEAGFTDGQTKTVDFGALTFTAAGDYTFTVVETDAAPANWTYASGEANARTITIHVTDPDNGGQLVASYDQDAPNNPTFINSYKADGTLDGDAEGTKNLMVTKTIDNRKFQEDDTFTFQLTADEKNPAGATLPDNADGLTIAYADGNDTATKSAAFGDITFTLPGTYTFYVSEVAPAEEDKLGGMTYSDERYTVTVEVTDAQDGNGKLDAAITKIVNKAGDEVEALAFTNTYEPGGTTDLPESGEGSIQLRKVLTGKAWHGDEFTFQIAAVSATASDGSTIDEVPMPDETEKTVSARTGTTEDGDDYADFGFGPITYDKAGTYVYEVREVGPQQGDPAYNAGITYDDHAATVTVSVVDNLHGGFTASASVENSTFTNEYASEINFAAAGGLEIVKTFDNADMREFSFTVTPADQKSADKLGIDPAGETLTTKPGATIGDGNASHAEVAVIDAATEPKFTQDDADDTYTYTVEEIAGSDANVTYDGTTYTVTITTTDDGQGGIKVTTTVTDGADYNQTYFYDNDDTTEDPTAIVPFTNTYKATGELGGNGSASIKATKTLTNRPMTDGEFTFNVNNANDPNNTVVATGTNAANGTITFSAIDYSIDQMLEDVDNGLAMPRVVDGKNTFTYTYQVTENTTNLDEGVAAIDAAGFRITVTVTDNGDGTLGIAVAYPNGGDGLTFRNTYGEGQTGQATLNVNGAKKLDVASGNNAPDIAGKYTFTLSGSEGAPMPATTTVNNDATGNVSFGDITYTMENVFGDTGSQGAATNAEGEPAVQSAARTKAFTYTVTESGSVAGVTNDAEASKAFTVTVTDNGDGSLSVATDPAQGALFSFTNEYGVDPATSSPTGDRGLTITKELAGRDLSEGEFTAVMVDATGAQVSQGVNDAAGNIELDAITFTKPGDYTYDLYEAPGDKGGVTYDAVRYTATAHVVDNGDGTMSVTWEFANAAGEQIDAIAFHNTYKADPTSVLIGGSKVLDGRGLAADEFEFQLADADGKVLQTVGNAADGGFCFDSIAYDQAGTYEYTISEVAGDVEGVTYDDATYAVKVVVTDDGEGNLVVSELTYNGEATLPVFHNTYVKPVEPPAPKVEVIPATGDAALAAVAATAGIGGVLAAAGYLTSKRRGE